MLSLDFAEGPEASSEDEGSDSDDGGVSGIDVPNLRFHHVILFIDHTMVVDFFFESRKSSPTVFYFYIDQKIFFRK